MAVRLANPPGTPPEKMMFRLSPSQLSSFVEDPRMFWVHHRCGTRLPEGISSSIPNDIDETMKARYDFHRQNNTMPEELKALADRGIKLCPDFALLERVRSYKTAPMYDDAATGCTMSGALDDIVVFPDGRMAPLDIKTTKLRDNFLSYATQWAQLAQSWYGILLMGVAPKGVHTHAFLPYYYPVVANDAPMKWECNVVEMPLDSKTALATFRAAIACLRGPLPPAKICKKGNKFDRDYDGWAHEYSMAVATHSAPTKTSGAKVVAAAAPDMA